VFVSEFFKGVSYADNRGTITPEGRDQLANVVATHLGEAEGYIFNLRSRMRISPRARGLVSALALAHHLKFKCSQQYRRPQKSSDTPYSLARNTRPKKKQFDCKGEINIYFLDPTSLPDMEEMPEIAIEYFHAPHPGRRQFGLPIKAREWIKNNPASMPGTQRENLLQAINRGEIPGLKEDGFISPTLVHYWWRKIFVKNSYISDDPWINVEHLLRRNEMVVLAFLH